MINVALIGLGRIGIMHAENLNSHKNFNLKYIFDINKTLTSKLSKKLNSTPINNPQEAFRDNTIKIIFIASSTPTHIKLIEEAAKHKKIIFCEKPLDLNIDKVNKCLKKIKRYNPKIQLGFNRRYDPGHNSIKRDLLRGKIGRLEKIIITSRDPAPPSFDYLKVSGGIFHDMMIHDFDLIRFYLQDDEIENIYSNASNISDKRFDKIKDYELASCILKTKKGVQCIITNSRHCSFGYDQRIELFGNKGMIISDNKRELETTIYAGSSTNIKAPLMHFFIERYSDAYKKQLDDLAKVCKKNIKPTADFEDGRRSLVLAETASKSLKSKKFERVIF